MSVGSRMKERRESLGMTQIQLAEALGLTKGAIGNYETEANSPKASILYKIFEVLKCDANYLFQDEMKELETDGFTVAEIKIIKKYRILDEYGKEVVDSVLDIEHKRISQTPATEILNEDNIIQFHVPEYWQTVSAGTGDWNDDDSWEDLLLTKQPPKGAAYVVRVSGDSMEPTFQHGDRLFIRPQDTLENGQIGIFVMDSCMYVKELRKGCLISHNPEYEPILLNESARCQGRVLGVCDESYFEK